MTRLIVDEHDAGAFAPIAASPSAISATGCCRAADEAALTALAPGLTPEMVAAVSKLMRVQDLILVAAQMPRRDAFPRHHRSARHAFRRGCSRTIRPTIRTGIAASILDGLLYGSGDAVIGINPATDSVAALHRAAAACSTMSSTATTFRRNPAC